MQCYNFFRISTNNETTNMDEYCNHCAEKHGMNNSFIGLVQSGKTANVYCKGCGITHVNHLGECLKCKYKSNIVTYIQSKSFLILMMLCAIFIAIISISIF